MRFGGAGRDRFRVRLITPAFAYGARGGEDLSEPEIRASSLRGLLRWWFRITANGALKGSGMSGAKSLRCVRKMEDRIFGSTNGASLAKLRIGREDLHRVKAFEIFKKCCEIEVDGCRRIEASNGEMRRIAQYCVSYLGYGIPKGAVGLEGEFDLIVDFDWRSSDLEREILRMVVGVWGALGGIGRRQRKGMGSVALVEAPEVGEVKLISRPFDLHNVKTLLGVLGELIRRYSRETGCGSLPEGGSVDNFGELEASSFRPVIGPPYEGAVEALKELAFRFRRFREKPDDKSRCMKLNRREGEIKPVRQRTVQYLRIVRKIMRSPGGGELPALEWSVFGLPHNYYSRGREGRGKARVFINWRNEWLGIKGSRRASPVFAKVISSGDLEYRPMVFTIPSDYLPRGSELIISVEMESNRKDSSWEEIGSYHARVPSMKMLGKFISYLEKVWEGSEIIQP